MSNPQIKTPPHEWNLDWYRVKYRLASTLANDAWVNKTDFAPASKEVESLLHACWRVLDPLPWKRLKRKNRETIRFVDETVVLAVLDLKALIDLGLDGFDPGEDERWGLRSVRRRLRAGKPVPPLTIVEAISASKKKHGPSLSFDLACFFHLSGNDERAAEFVKQGFDAVPAEKMKRYRERVAADPMLRSIPGAILPPEVLPVPKKTKKSRKKKAEKKSRKKPRDDGEEKGAETEQGTRPWV